MSGQSNIVPQAIEALPCQLPPEGSFVPLSHAVSWIALRHSLAGPALSKLLGIGTVRDESDDAQDQWLDETIAGAVKRLTDLGSGRAVEIRGRFFRDVLDDENHILTRRIPAVRLADYRWFDTLDDCLFRGLGLAWGWDRRELCCPQGDRGHFRFVTVNRVDLMRIFPSGEAEPQVQLQPFTVDEIDEWIQSTFHTGMKMARPSFLKEPRAKGLSATFEDRWNAIKQNKVGRPTNR